MSENISTAFTISQVTWKEAQVSLKFIRHAVFIMEQNVTDELEWDGLDDEAIHILVLTADDKPVATARLLTGGHIGRMAVLKAWRHQGIGSAILLRLIEIAQRQALVQINLDAQTHAISFYEGYGFEVCSEIFMDAGIPHKKMKRLLGK